MKKNQNKMPKVHSGVFGPYSKKIKIKLLDI
jgi:hypothetical protein